MEIKILDEFPPWSIYLLALIVMATIAAALAVSVLSYRRRRRRVRSPQTQRGKFQGRGPAVLISIIGGLALSFFATSMFLRFHAIAIGSNRVELVYFWPRPPVTIRMNDLDEVKIVPAGRACGYMQITTQGQAFRSVSFKRCKVAEEVRQLLTDRAHLRAR